MIILNDGHEIVTIFYICDNDNDITDEFLGLSDLECYGEGKYIVYSVCSVILSIEDWISEDEDKHTAEFEVHTF